MEYYLSDDKEAIRVANSPRRSPHITQGLASPKSSVHATQMDALHMQPDVGLRTVDFFDDSSDEGSTHGVSPRDVGPNIDHVDRGGSAEKKRQTASTVEPFASHDSRISRLESDFQGYQPLTADEEHHGESPMVDTASSSFHGSIEELLPSGTHSSPPQQFRSRIANEHTPRSPVQAERPEQRHLSVPATKLDQTLAAHAIAHEITLNALIRDEEALGKTLQAYVLAPLSAEARQSVLPSVVDPRSPRARYFSSPATASTTKKSVHLVPPPIDIEASKRPIPDDIVRTPYPFTPDHPKRKDSSRRSTSGGPSATGSTAESILTISIRRGNANIKTRVTSLTIPATNDFTALRLNSIGAKERHFKALDFDDAEFFRELRKCYRTLAGPLRFLSARSLTRIAVCGPAMKAANAGYGWRSPYVPAGRRLSDTFSEEQILRHYRTPKLGHSRYAFVHWAHRLASAAPAEPVQREGEVAQAETTETSGEEKRPEGLEFLVTWSVRRILLVFLLVLALSTAAALLWIFLGRNTVAAWPQRGGFKDAGDRVGTGVLIGICVLLLGLSSMAGWLGVSWLLM